MDGELNHERTEFRVVGIAPGLQAKHRGGVGGDLSPVGVELAGVRVEEDEPGLVAGGGGQLREVGDEPAGEPVLAQDVEAAAENEGRFQRVVEGVEHLRVASLSRCGLSGRRRRDGTPAHATLDWAGETNHNQLGDPAKGATLIHRVVSGERLPLHLPLGQDALDRRVAMTARLERELEPWWEASADTACDD